jgi:hypothetical protein
LTDSQPDIDTEPAGAVTADPSAGHGEVRAERVEISQGGASTISAHTVTLTQGGAARVRATEMSVSQGGVGVARVDRLVLNENAGAIAVVADEATMTGNASAVLLVAGRTNGPVRAVVDLRAAAAFGAAFAVVYALLRRIF